MHLESLYTVAITPFDPQGNLNLEGLKQNLRFQISQGVKGIVVLGTTGEAPTLSATEKRRIIETARDELAGKASLLVGTGSYSTEQTIANTKEAKQLGADGALIVTPYYNKPTQEGLFRHFAAVCEAVEFPICIYNIQGRTGQNLETATLCRLFQFPSIIGVKESSGNMTQIIGVIDAADRSSRPISILSGDDALTLPLMALGGTGIFSVASNLIPAPILEMVNAAAAGNFFRARTLHFQMLPFFRAAFLETNPIPIKSAMSLCGMPAGICRLPLCEMDPAKEAILKEVVQSLPSSWIASESTVSGGSCG